MGFLVQAKNGNFEVVVPRLGGGIDHFWRDNAQAALPWHGPLIAFGSMGDIGAVSLIQSAYGAGNLEVVCSEGDRLVHVWRENVGLHRWNNHTFLPGNALPGSSPSLLQATNGNLEVVAPLGGGGMGHWYRDHASWQGPFAFGSDPVAAVALIQNTSGNLEVVARANDELRHWWRDGAGTWHSGAVVATGAAGHHDLLLDQTGDFQLLAPLVGGGFGHWTRANAPGFPWHGPEVFGAAVVATAGAALARHASGNLEAVVRVGDHLEHWWHHGIAWHGPTVFGQAVSLDPTSAGDCRIAYDTGVVGVHAVLLRTGKVLLFSFTDFSDGQGDGRLLDPGTGAVETPINAHHHLFCSGHCVAPDGRVVVAGGHHDEVTKVHTFDPDTAAWAVAGTEMAVGRWYPTCTTLPDGQVLAMSGTKSEGPVSPTNEVNNTMQVVDPGGPQAERAIPSPFSAHFPPQLPTIDLYPFVFVLPSGGLLVHSRHVTRFYDPDNDAWSGDEVLTQHPFSRTYPGEGTCVLLPLRPQDGYRARVLIAGGGAAEPLTRDIETTASAEILDLGAQPLQWRPVASMGFARVMPDGVLLPDGTVAIIGGSSRGYSDQAIDPVLPIELFDPSSGTFSTMCSVHAPRLYHSTALLLPDASVLIAGKDGVYNADPYHYPERRGEIFRPPYLFRGGGRPVIDSVPAEVGYASPFAVRTQDATDIRSVVLVRPGSVTHSFNMDQRLVELEITGRTGGRLEVEGPPNPNIAPPGHYMLFLLGEDGVPSEARFVHL